MADFVAARYRQDGRYRWAVCHTPTQTWYFAERYGRAAAVALANKLNKETQNGPTRTTDD